MRLHTRTWGDGDRTVVLVHGIMSDSRCWRRVGPEIAERHGYRVVAVDLRGHGASPRGDYSPRQWADDLAETLPAGADLALGHSLGGLALSLAVPQLRPARAVYADPVWTLGTGSPRLDVSLFAAFKNASRDSVVAMNPHWDGADVDVELASLGDWDPDTAEALQRATQQGDGAPLLPDGAEVPSLVLRPDRNPLVGTDWDETLTGRGFTVRTVPHAGHTLYRDNPDGFFQALAGWL